MADKKRKGLMSLLSEYQTEKGYGGKVSGKGPVKSGKEYGKTLKKNKKEDSSGPKVLAPKNPAAKKTTSNPKPNRTTPRTNKPQAPASVQKGNGDGTYGKSMPSNPKLKNITMKPRKKRPGTGRTGEAAAKAGTRVQGTPKTKHKETMTAAKRRAMRLRARRGR